MPGKSEIKEQVIKNFDKLILFGVIGLICITFIMTLFQGSPGEKAQQDLRRISEVIEARVVDEASSRPVATLNPNILPVARGHFTEVPAGVDGPSWVPYKIPYIKKDWKIVQQTRVKHPAPREFSAKDMEDCIEVTWKAGKWRRDIKGKVEFKKLVLMRKKGDGKWEIVKTLEKGDFDDDEEYEYKFRDKDYQENTEYEYSLSSEAEVTFKPKQMYLLDKINLKLDKLASAKTKFRFKILKVVDVTNSCVTHLSIYQKLKVSGQFKWIKWPRMYFHKERCALPRQPGFESATSELKYRVPKFVRNKETLKVAVYELKSGKPVSMKNKVEVQVEDMDLGYNLMNWEMVKDASNNDIGHLTLQFRKNKKNILTLKFKKNGTPVPNGADSGGTGNN